MKNSLYILRNFQSQNYGDHLINDYLISQLSLHCRLDILYHPKTFMLLQEMNCLQSANVNLLEWYPNFDRRFLWEVIRKKTSYDYIFLIPGHSSSKGFKSKITQIKNTYILLLLQFLGVRCIWICKSLDNLDFLGKLLEKQLSKYIHQYSVRDSLSNLNNNLNAEVWPDLAFLMYPNEGKNLSSNSKIVFSFRGDRGEISQNIVKQFCLSVTKRILAFKSLDEIICLANVSHDILFMEKLSREIEQDLRIRVKFIDNSNLTEIINLYNKNSLVFTDRLHVALPAMINHSPAFPFINLPLDQKIFGIYKDMGWEELIIPRPLSLKETSGDFNLDNVTPISMLEISDSIKKSRIKLMSNIAKIFN
jgi:polysaccharide pyruvyl transferase WcaK-like protein